MRRSSSTCAAAVDAVDDPGLGRPRARLRRRPRRRRRDRGPRRPTGARRLLHRGQHRATRRPDLRRRSSPPIGSRAAVERRSRRRAARDHGPGRGLPPRPPRPGRGHRPPAGVPGGRRRLPVRARRSASLDEIRTLVAEVDRPRERPGPPGAPTIAELAEAGVRRVSVGGGFAWAAVGGLVDAGEELLDARHLRVLGPGQPRLGRRPHRVRVAGRAASCSRWCCRSWGRRGRSRPAASGRRTACSTGRRSGCALGRMFGLGVARRLSVTPARSGRLSSLGASEGRTAAATTASMLGGSDGMSVPWRVSVIVSSTPGQGRLRALARGEDVQLGALLERQVVDRQAAEDVVEDRRGDAQVRVVGHAGRLEARVR